MRGLVPLLFLVLALAGCSDPPANEPSVARLTTYDVDPDDSSSRAIDCGAKATLHVVTTAGETGDLSYTVKAGSNSVLLHQGTVSGASASDTTKDLTGPSGIWVLTVSKTLEYDGTFTLTLTCA